MKILIAVVLVALAVFAAYELGSSRKPQGVVIMEELGTSSSPIIVGSSSIHFRQEGKNLRLIDDNHIYYDLDSHVAVDVRMAYCVPQKRVNATNCTLGTPSPSGATPASPMQAPWSLQVIDTKSATIGTFHVADAMLPGFMLISTSDYNHEFFRDQDDGANGWGYVVDDCTTPPCMPTQYPIGSAILTNGSSAPVTLSAPANPSATQTQYMIFIRYCSTTTTDAKCGDYSGTTLTSAK